MLNFSSIRDRWQADWSFSERRKLRKSGVLLLISGGCDSVAAFDLLSRLRDAGVVKKVFALHINYGLRGRESDGDEKFVRRLCRTHHVPLIVKKPKDMAGVGLQERARVFRYQEAEKIVKKHRCALIVTAHHEDDQLETLIFRHERGAGVSGFSGIRKLSVREKYFVYRPLLDFKKSEILNYLKIVEQDYREDSSNASSHYARNQIRKNLAVSPLLEEKRKQILLLRSQIEALDFYWLRYLFFTDKKYIYGVPAKIWFSWSEELQFRFLKQKAQKNQVELSRLHFKNFLKTGILQIGTFHWRQDKDGIWNLAEMIEGIQTEKGLLRTMQHGDKFIPPGHQSPRKIGDFFNSRGIGKYRRLLWPLLVDENGIVQKILNL